MRNITILLSTCSLISSTLYAQTTDKPNIIMFLVDDMGWQDTSVPFFEDNRTLLNERYHTPNMERLAQMGVRFTEAYACAISSPTRCSLMSGMNAARHKVTNWTLELNQKTDESSDVIKLPEWHYNGIQPAESSINNSTPITSFPQLLKENGYRTIHCGKAHFGARTTPGENPLNMGFDVNIAGGANGAPGSYLGTRNFGEGSRFAVKGLEKYYGQDIFITEALTREALKEIDQSVEMNKPFYLYMSHYAIHIPIDKDMRFYPKYLKKGLTEKEAAYASLIEGMDKSLGDLMDWLDKNDEADNTIIIFMSDNGGLASEPAWRDGELHTQNYPLNSGKGSLYEGGIREPMIVKWPGVVSPGTRCDKYLMIEDFYPTILEMAGVQNYRTVQPLDGTSFMPLLKGTGDPSKGRAIVWNFPNIWGNNGPGINLNCSIRKDEWKLVYYYETGKKELFNIPEDIGEKHDVAAQHPDIVKRLSKELGTYLRNVGGQRPGFKATNKPCPWPDEV